MRDEIWVFIEYQDGEMIENCKEILYEAHRLARIKGKTVHALVMGKKVKEVYEDIKRYGVVTIYSVEHSLLATYTTDAYVAALESVLTMYRPLLLFMPSTTDFRDLAPRLAARMKTGVVTDCVKFTWGSDDVLLMTKFIYNRKAHCTFDSHTGRTQLATVLPKVFPPALPKQCEEEVPVYNVPIRLNSSDIRTQVLGVIEAEASSVDLSEASMIVAGGRGAKSKEGFMLIHELAYALGASVGASRVATDEGWVPFERQIGQTGKVVAPKLYIACGISGAIHHTMGIKDSGTIIAINYDKSAAIFGLSDIGLVGDMHEVIPLLIQKIQKYKEEQKTVAQQREVAEIR